ncbi:DUF2591 domain-containing protein [Pseudomonas tructae]|uniref:DUF2591 domain-containing protein n=1 Tax=Pseudomonas tructae TaxID=2518644 RepID=A0A411MKA7_9PSED|nr:DUF2591 domain-containing protein [Pseudomonas tructae]QBF27197.1 DUF2591 domain-containing protein [Pseudomonas tructae]
MTDLIEVKTADLVGEPLNWSVAIAVGLNPFISPAQYGVPARVFIQQEGMFPVRYKPSVDWQVGGPLIEKHQVSLHCPQTTDDVWAAWVITDKGEFVQPGDHALLAACRAIVTAKLGDTVQVPKELQP